MTEGSSQAGLRIDLGCGAIKKEGTIGVDHFPVPGVVDHVVNIEQEPLPFPDRSVEYVHSSHFLEHTRDIGKIFREIGRVCVDGARLELWTPYVWSNGGFMLDHKTFLTEDIYLHMCVLYRDHWRDILAADWVLEEIQYVVSPEALCRLDEQGFSLDFALRYMTNVSPEFCAHVRVYHEGERERAEPRRTFSTGRFEPRFNIKPDAGTEPDPAAVQQAIFKNAAAAPLPPFSDA